MSVAKRRLDLLDLARGTNREIAARADQMLREPMGRDEVAGVFMSLAQTLDYLITALGIELEEEP